MQTRLSIALLATLATLGAATSAHAAATAGYSDPGTITYTADANQANALTVTYPAGTPASTVVIQDAANPVTAGNACTQTNANTVTCTLLGPVALAIATADGPDSVAFSGPASTTAISGITLDGGAGSDTLHGPAADVATTFIGGTGNDTFDPNGVAPGHATVSYADGRTTGVTVDLAAHTGIGAGGEQDTIGAGIENATGGAGNDTLVGDDQANTLTGGAGDDVLRGGLGLDHLTGGNGTDTASYSDRAAGHGVTASIAGGGGEGGEGDVFATIENLQGGAGNDTLTGDGGANTLNGGAGDDTLSDGDSGSSPFQTADDVLIGGDGNDTVTYAARSDALTLKIDGAADSGDKAALPSPEADTIATDVENVTGGSGSDTITGSAAGNVLDGGPGGDTLDGGLGDDALTGGPGTDTVTYASRTAPLTVTLDGLANDGAAGENDNVSAENVTGGSGDDHLTGDGQANTLDGGAGDDTLDGGLGGDALVGGAGEDVADYSLRTGAVNVTLDGTGTANDGESGEGDKVQTEDVIGGSGNDALTGDGGANVLVGGPGNDTLSGGDGSDVLVGAAGDDNLSGGAGDDDLGPGAGNDTVFGGSNPAAPADEDTLDLSDRSEPFVVDLATGTAVSGTEHDVVDSVEDVVGGAGDDKISGDANNNTLTGGEGVDVLDGRAGNDKLLSRDTKGDTDTCGDGADSVSADVLDTVGADCESVDRGALPTLTIDVVKVAEGNSGTTNATLTVTLSAASLAPVTVGYQSGGGNATPGSDYTAVSGTVTFPAGTTKQTIAVPIIGDTAYESDEALLVGLANPTNATLGTPAVGGVVIVNDDPKPAPPAAKCTVPNVARHTLTYARSRIAKAGCKVGTIKHRYSSTIRKGRISKQGPRAGTTVAAGTKVTLVQSLGRRPSRRT